MIIDGYIGYNAAAQAISELQQAGRETATFVQQHALLVTAIALGVGLLYRWTMAPPR